MGWRRNVRIFYMKDWVSKWHFLLFKMSKNLKDLPPLSSGCCSTFRYISNWAANREMRPGNSLGYEPIPHAGGIWHEREGSKHTGQRDLKPEIWEVVSNQNSEHLHLIAALKIGFCPFRRSRSGIITVKCVLVKIYHEEIRRTEVLLTCLQQQQVHTYILLQCQDISQVLNYKFSWKEQKKKYIYAYVYMYVCMYIIRLYPYTSIYKSYMD